MATSRVVIRTSTTHHPIGYRKRYVFAAIHATRTVAHQNGQAASQLWKPWISVDTTVTQASNSSRVFPVQSMRLMQELRLVQDSGNLPSTLTKSNHWTPLQTHSNSTLSHTHTNFSKFPILCGLFKRTTQQTKSHTPTTYITHYYMFRLLSHSQGDSYKRIFW